MEKNFVKLAIKKIRESGEDSEIDGWWGYYAERTSPFEASLLKNSENINNAIGVLCMLLSVSTNR